MTTEHRLVFDVRDLRGLRVECTRCHAAITYRLDRHMHIPSDCPSCGETLKDQYHPGFAQEVENLANALRAIAATSSVDTPCTLRFELDAPPPSPLR